MTEKTEKQKKKPKSKETLERMAVKLRENLRRRKVQTKERKQAPVPEEG